MKNLAEKNIGGTTFFYNILLGVLLLIVGTPTTFAQELEPRNYTNTPIGINFIGAAFGVSQGNVLLDPALPIEDLDGDTNYSIVRYVRSFGLLNRSAKLKLLVPATTGDWEGSFEGESGRRSASGFGDARVELSWNFIGAPALTAEQIRDYKQQTVVGTSLRIIAPTGEYDGSRLINLGSNRWSVRGEIGVSRALGKWAVELATSVWVFGNNDDFFGGQHLSQEDLYVIKSHLVYTIRPGFWLGIGLGMGNGGRTTVNGVPRDNRQKNLRIGANVAYPINKHHGISLALITAKNRGAGSEFDSIALGYQYAWGNL